MELSLLRTFLRSGHDSKINEPMELGVGQALDLWDVEVGVDVSSFEISGGLVRQDTRARLGMRLSFIARCIHDGGTYSMDKDRSNTGLLEPGLQTP